MEIVISKVQELVATFGLKILAAVAILIMGRWASKFLTNMVRKTMAKRVLIRHWYPFLPT
ncbi:MAG TPA: hypothetical protein VGB26_06615 [Nitrospiria bacterium]|jgi:type III secretory pathway component EscS